MAQGVQRLSADGSPRRTLLIIGGAEDKLGRSVVLKRFVRLAGGRQSPDRHHPHRLLVRRRGRRDLQPVFTRLRAGGDIRVVHAASRAAARDPELVAGSRTPRRCS
jgi:cyanophycinase